MKNLHIIFGIILAIMSILGTYNEFNYMGDTVYMIILSLTLNFFIGTVWTGAELFNDLQKNIKFKTYKYMIDMKNATPKKDSEETI